MYKQIAIVLVYAFALAQAVAVPKPYSDKPISEEAGVRESMRNAFKQGLAKFEGVSSKVEEVEKVLPEVNKLKPHVYSQYTKGITAIGGGKPALTEQYRKNTFSPLVPSVVPPEHKVVSEKPTPEESARMYVPQPPFQYTTDRLY